MTFGQRLATMGSALMVVVFALSACSGGTPAPHTVNAVPITLDSISPAPTTAVTPSPSPTSTAATAPATTAPRPSPTTSAPKASSASTVSKPRPAASAASPNVQPTTARPLIQSSTLAWNNRNCLYQWDGVRWVFRNMCRTPQPNGAPDFAYRDDNDKLLFTATTSASLKLVWWTDAKLQYQQLTNYAPDAYGEAVFFLQQASFDGIDLLSLDAFFAATAQKQQFQASHPSADLTPGTRSSQWTVFRSTWWPAISASTCSAAYRCP